MSPLSPVVLGAAALVPSPALWGAAVSQSLSVDQALFRYLVAVAICWALLSVVTELALKPQTPAADDDPAGETGAALIDRVDDQVAH